MSEVTEIDLASTSNPTIRYDVSPALKEGGIEVAV
jgi:hypothetical protein